MGDLKFLDLLASKFESLPGVGKKTANRYAYHLIEQMTSEEVEEFAKVMVDTKKSVVFCPICGMLSLKQPCDICSSIERDKTKIMVLKDTKDIIAIETLGSYNGLYHSLNGLINPLDGIGPDEINVSSLYNRINSGVKEVIIATPFTINGETTTLFLEKTLSKYNIKISRLGYGLPAGGDIEYIDELTLQRAIENRTNK